MPTSQSFPNKNGYKNETVNLYKFIYLLFVLPYVSLTVVLDSSLGKLEINSTIGNNSLQTSLPLTSNACFLVRFAKHADYCINIAV